MFTILNIRCAADHFRPKYSGAYY